MITQDLTAQKKIDKYIWKLERSLKDIPKEERNENIMEIKSHIYNSIGSGKDVESVLAKLGNPKHYAKMIISEYLTNRLKKGNFIDNLKLFMKQMITPFILGISILIFI